MKSFFFLLFSLPQNSYQHPKQKERRRKFPDHTHLKVLKHHQQKACTRAKTQKTHHTTRTRNHVAVRLVLRHSLHLGFVEERREDLVSGAPFRCYIFTYRTSEISPSLSLFYFFQSFPLSVSLSLSKTVRVVGRCALESSAKEREREIEREFHRSAFF